MPRISAFAVRTPPSFLNTTARFISRLVRRRTATFRRMAIFAVMLALLLPVPAAMFAQSSRAAVSPKIAVKTNLSVFGEISEGAGFVFARILGFFGTASVRRQRVAAYRPLTAEQNSAAVARIGLNIQSTLDLWPGQTLMAGAVPFDANGNAVQGLAAVWQSSAPAVVSVERDGRVEARHAGTAQLTATAGNQSATVRVTVLDDNTLARTSTDGDAPAGVADTKSDDTPGANGRVIEPLRPDGDGQLPDDETGSLYDSMNDVGTPPGRTEPGAPNPIPGLRGRETPGSSNFSFDVPVASLPGRGVDAALALQYNSLLWNQSTTAQGQTHMTYDVDEGWPAPGFRLGYGQMERQGQDGFTLTDPDGTRHQMAASTGPPAPDISYYESTDSTYIRYAYDRGMGSGTATYTDGTQVQFSAARTGRFTTSVYSYPVRITDRNGNSIQINYVGGVGPQIASIIDTMNRYINFYYDADGRLVTITVPGYNDGVQPLADRKAIRFYYEDITLNATFQSRFVVTAPQTARVIRYVYFPGTQSGYRYDYSSYGMIYQTTQLRAMTVSTDDKEITGEVTSDGQTASTSTYDYPLGPSYLSAAPAYQHRTDDWAGRTTAAQPVTTFAVNQQQGTSTITTPDGTVSTTQMIIDPGVWDDGLVSDVTVTSNNRTLSKARIDWEHDGTQRNQRQHRTLITNEAGQRRGMIYGYTNFNNVSSLSERDFDAAGGGELRRTEMTYETRAGWTERRLVRLLTGTRVYDGTTNVLTARMEYSYDDYEDAAVGALTDRPGIVMYDDPATTYRGNRTIMRRYPNPADEASAITDTMSYDIAGNVVRETVDCCQQKLFTYDAAYHYAYVTQVMRGDVGQFTSSASYDYNTGAVTSATDENNQTTSTSYNVDPVRPKQTIRPDGGNTQWTYFDALTPDPDQSHQHSYVATTTSIDSASAVTSTTYTDGRGAQVRSFTQTPDGFVTADVEYDGMQRPSRTSNPYYSTGSNAGINPLNRWTTRQYDGLGRAYRVTLPDNTSVETDYTGGTAITATDQAGKSRRQITDALGRVVRLDEPDDSGTLGTLDAPTQPTLYKYSAIDNLVQVTQGQQNRYFLFDGMSRMTYARQVEMDAPYTVADSLTGNDAWSMHTVYNNRSLVTDSYDARNVHTHVDYDGLNRARSVTYSDATPAATYTYDEAHTNYFNQDRLTKVETAETSTAPATAQAFDYDLMGRVAGHSQTIGASIYPTGYSYNLVDEMTTETYPSGRVVTNAYDAAARMTGVADATRSYVSGIGYAAHGALAAETWGNGAVHSLAYNERLQATQIKLAQAGGAELKRFDYKYGTVNAASGVVDASKNNGQIGFIDYYRNGAKVADERYVYDSVGRLDRASEYLPDGTLNYRYDYDYDRYGNRFQPAQGTQNFQVTYLPVERSDVSAASNRFTANMGYDAAGNVTTDGKYRYQLYDYDANHRLIQTSRPDSSRTSAVYDGAGQRVQTTIERNEYHHYVYDALGRVIAEYGSDGWVRDRIYRGGEMIATDEAIGTCLKTIEQFVNAFYWGALGRFPSDAERQSESTQLRSAQAQGQSQMVAEAQRFGRELFHSAEYAARSRTDGQFVHDMYYAWQQRPADESGYQGWLVTIGAQGREHVIEGFAEGGEFAGRVGELCAGMQTEAVQWQMTDHAGTVRLVVNASGAVIDGHDTTPFGDEIGWGGARSANAPQQQKQGAEMGAGTTGLYGWNETMRARYASLERDTPTGLEHTDWRKYDAWQGRWTSTDPSHQSMSVGNPQSFNRYAYVQNDPVNFVDPSGLDGGADFLTALLLGAQVGASFSVYGGGDGFLGGSGGSGGRHVPAMELGNDEFNTGGGDPPNSGRAPLTGDMLSRFTETRDRLVKLLRDKNSDCAKFLRDKVGVSGSRVARTILGQRAFDGAASTISLEDAGTLPRGSYTTVGNQNIQSTASVSEFLARGGGSAVQASYARASTGATFNDVYYLGIGIHGSTILHEALHTLLGASDEALDKKGADVVSLTKAGCIE